MADLKPGQAPVQKVGRIPKDVAGLDGTVYVRTRMLADRVALSNFRATLPPQRDGEPDHDFTSRIGSWMAAKTLSLQVEYVDATPVYTVDEWSAFGNAHPDSVLALFEACGAQSGDDVEAVAKNSLPSRTGDTQSRSPFGWAARLLSLVTGSRTRSSSNA
jgi:hypothetical protein